MYGRRQIHPPPLFYAITLMTSPLAASGLNPEAPPETEQFAFMLGEWECTTRFMKPDGSGYNEGRARWTGHYTLNGWAIQDDWIGYGPAGQENHGLNIRSFNPEIRR